MNLNRTRAALYMVCIARAGYLDGARLIEFIEDWQRTVAMAGRALTPAEYIARSRRYPMKTAYRRLQLFRDTFPQLGPEGLPSGLMAPLLERLSADVDAVLDEGLPSS